MKDHCHYNSVNVLISEAEKKKVNSELEMIHLNFHCEAEIPSAHGLEAAYGQRKIRCVLLFMDLE